MEGFSCNRFTIWSENSGILKAGQFADQIPASWFWARVTKRSVALGYPNGGFDTLAKAVAQKIISLGGEISYNTELKTADDQFDQIISTAPPPKLPSLGAVTLILRLKKPFLPDNTYWLNIGRPDFPFLNIVEHTNLISGSNYDHEHLVYIGKYLPITHPYYLLSKQELLKRYDQKLSSICPEYKDNLIGIEVFRAPRAQPIIPLNYSQIIPSIKTEVKGLYRISMEQVYPFDRGTNYAVKLGVKVAKMIIKHAKEN